MNWPGVRRDTTEVGDGLFVSENTRYRYEGELRQRIGLTPCTAPTATNAVTQIFESKSYVFVGNGTGLKRYAKSSLTTGTPASGDTVSHTSVRPTVFSIEDVVYIYGGSGDTAVWDIDNGVESIGLSAPVDYTEDFEVVAASGLTSVGVGSHLLRARYTKTRGTVTVWSNPSTIETVIATEDQAIALGEDPFPVEASGITRYVEITTGDGVSFYQTTNSDWVHNVSDSRYEYDQTDSWLQQQNPVSLIGDYGHEAPYDSSLAVYVRGHVFTMGYASAPNRMYWSQPGLPESFYKTRFFRDMLNNGDTVAGLIEHYGDVWVFGRSTTERYVWSTDPEEGEKVTVPGTLGIWNQRCLAKGDNALFGWGPNGIWALSGGLQRHISRPVDDILQDNQDTDESDQFHMVWNPDERTLFCFYVASGDSYPYDAVCFDVDRGVWYTASWDIGITCSAKVMTADRPRVLLGDEYGKVWFQLGSYDGILQTNDYTPIPTVDGVVSTTISFSELIDPCVGAMLYQPSSGELRRIVTSGGDAVVLASTFTTDPVIGEQLAIGGISWQVTTKWWHDSSLAIMKQPVGLYIEFVPQDSGTLTVEIYRDFSDTLVTFEALDTDTLPEDITLENGVFKVDMTGSGFARVPIECDYARSLRAVLKSDRLLPTPQLLRVAFQPKPHGSHKGDME